MKPVGAQRLVSPTSGFTTIPTGSPCRSSRIGKRRVRSTGWQSENPMGRRKPPDTSQKIDPCLRRWIVGMGKGLIFLSALVLASGCSNSPAPNASSREPVHPRKEATAGTGVALKASVLGAWQFDPESLEAGGVRFPIEKLPKADRQKARDLIAAMKGFTFYFYKDSTWKSVRAGRVTRGTWQVDGNEIVIVPPKNKGEVPPLLGRLLGNRLVVHVTGVKIVDIAFRRLPKPPTASGGSSR